MIFSIILLLLLIMFVLVLIKNVLAEINYKIDYISRDTNKKEDLDEKL